MQQVVIEYVLISILMVLTIIIFGYLTLDENVRKDKKKFVVTIFVSSIMSILIVLFFKGSSKTIANFLLYIFIFHEVFKEKFPKSIFVTFIYIVVSMVADMLTLVFFIVIVMLSSILF